MIRINGPITEPFAQIVGMAIKYDMDLTAAYTDGVWSILGDGSADKPPVTNPFDTVPAKPDTTIDNRIPVTPSPTPTPFG